MRPGWQWAGHLRTGDHLRTATGVDVVVTGLRYNVGHAVVYTLTVAHDHTFFVGTVRVLVHNCMDSSTIKRRVEAVLKGKAPSTR